MNIRSWAILGACLLCAACTTTDKPRPDVPNASTPSATSQPAAPAAIRTPGAAATSPATAATPASITYAGGDGSSLPQAIVILGAPNSMAGIRAEYAWLARQYPGHQRRSQSLIKSESKSYDMLEVQLPDGRTTKFYFDITAFFGRF